MSLVCIAKSLRSLTLKKVSFKSISGPSFFSEVKVVSFPKARRSPESWGSGFRQTG